MIKSFAKLCSLICICICFTSCESNSEPDDSEPFVCTNRDEWINEFGDDRLLEKVLHTNIPSMPMNIYPTPNRQELYLGACKGYEILIAPDYFKSYTIYKINNYYFEKSIYCVKQDWKMLDARYNSLLQNDFEDLFSQNVFDVDDLEQIYCSYIVRINEIYKENRPSSDVVFELKRNVRYYEKIPVYRQVNATDDIEYLDYSVCDFSSQPLDVRVGFGASSYGENFSVDWKCIELGTFSGYTFYLSLNHEVLNYRLFYDSIDHYFDNKYYFNNKDLLKGIFCVKANVLYNQEKCFELYRDKEITDENVEIMARKTFSYYYDFAENKEEFKQNYISEWNKNYRNPDYKYNMTW